LYCRVGNMHDSQYIVRECCIVAITVHKRDSTKSLIRRCINCNNSVVYTIVYKNIIKEYANMNNLGIKNKKNYC